MLRSAVVPQDQQGALARAMLKWILHNDSISVVVTAMNALHHLDDAVAASGAELTDEETALLEDLATRAPTYEASYFRT